MKYTIRSVSWHFTFFKSTYVIPQSIIELDADDLDDRDLKDLSKLLENDRIRLSPSYDILYDYVLSKYKVTPPPEIIKETPTETTLSDKIDNALLLLDDGLYVKDLEKVLQGVHSDLQLLATTEQVIVIKEQIQKLESKLINLDQDKPLEDLSEVDITAVCAQIDEIRATLTTLPTADMVAAARPQRTFTEEGEVDQPIKTFYGATTSNKDGTWSFDYSLVGFTKILSIVITPISVGTSTSDRRLATIQSESLTGCSGLTMSGTAAGALVAMALVNEPAKIYIKVTGI